MVNCLSFGRRAGTQTVEPPVQALIEFVLLSLVLHSGQQFEGVFASAAYLSNALASEIVHAFRLCTQRAYVSDTAEVNFNLLRDPLA